MAGRVISHPQASCVFTLLTQWVTEQGRGMAESQHKLIHVDALLCGRRGFEVCSLRSWAEPFKALPCFSCSCAGEGWHGEL